jgi:hypothetical protein
MPCAARCTAHWACPRRESLRRSTGPPCARPIAPRSRCPRGGPARGPCASSPVRFDSATLIPVVGRPVTVARDHDRRTLPPGSPGPLPNGDWTLTRLVARDTCPEPTGRRRLLAHPAGSAGGVARSVAADSHQSRSNSSVSAGGIRPWIPVRVCGASSPRFGQYAYREQLSAFRSLGAPPDEAPRSRRIGPSRPRVRRMGGRPANSSPTVGPSGRDRTADASPTRMLPDRWLQPLPGAARAGMYSRLSPDSGVTSPLSHWRAGRWPTTVSCRAILKMTSPRNRRHSKTRVSAGFGGPQPGGGTG